MVDTNAPTQSPDGSANANTGPGNEHDQISQNIAAVYAFYAREAGKLTPSQRFSERLSDMVGQTRFLAFIVVLVALWVAADLLCIPLGRPEFDPAPFFWLQGLVGLAALLTATVVLIKQNRLAKLAEQRANLDLKVMLLTEQKAAKLIDLIEELRRDLPNVKDRHDANAESLQNAMSPSGVLAALDERVDPVERVAAATAQSSELPAPM